MCTAKNDLGESNMISNFEQLSIIPIIGSVFAVLFVSAIFITICKNNPDCGSNCCASKQQLNFQVINTSRLLDLLTRSKITSH